MDAEAAFGLSGGLSPISILRFALTSDIALRSAGLGMFIDELFRGWIKAAQAADTNPASVASRILQWQEDDDYGFTHEIWKQVSPILNAKGKAAYRKVLEDRCFAKNAKAKRAGDGHKEVTWAADIDALKVVYAAQKDFDAFQSLAEQSRLNGGRRRPPLT